MQGDCIFWMHRRGGHVTEQGVDPVVAPLPQVAAEQLPVPGVQDLDRVRDPDSVWPAVAEVHRAEQAPKAVQEPYLAVEPQFPALQGLDVKPAQVCEA